MLLIDTSFPRFEFDKTNHYKPRGGEYDDLSLAESDEAEEATISRKVQQFQTKQDQDVAVFMQIAAKMDLSSLIFILQGHAKAQNLPVSVQTRAAAKLIHGGKEHDDDDNDDDDGNKNKKKKQFRFATVNNGMVKCVYHVVPSVKDCTDMWWTDAEMKQIRSAAIQDVKYYRKYRADYKQTIEILANDTTTTTSSKGDAAAAASGGCGDSGGDDTKGGGRIFSSQTIQNHLKKLMEDSYARGLEVHIVNLLSDLRRETVRAVLEEQAECRMCGDSLDVTMESLREQSLAYTCQSRNFALKLGQCDQVEALKASLANHWEAEKDDDMMSTNSKDSNNSKKRRQDGNDDSCSPKENSSKHQPTNEAEA